MSRRRKNEGVGYGYTFHGAFNEKADAVKKEAKTPGSFIKGSLTAKGYRWIVMKPRKNPMRRRARVNKAKPIVKDYTQISAITGKKIRKATMVVFPDGRQYKFQEKLPKRLAIKEAIRHLGIGDNPSTLGVNPQRYEVIEVNADKKRRALLGGMTKQEAREVVKKLKKTWGAYGVRFETKLESARNAGAGRNPAELIVLGANPGDDHYLLEAVSILFPGKTPRDLTPRELSIALQKAARLKNDRTGTNPVNPTAPYSAAHARAAGIERQAPGLIRTGRQRRVARMVRQARKHKDDWAEDFGRDIRERGLNPIAPETDEERAARLKEQREQDARLILRREAAGTPRRNVEFGEYENGIFHPWTRRPKTRRKHAIRRRRASNPSAEGIREYFTGAPAASVSVENEPHMPAGDYAQLGELLVLYVKPIAGGQVRQIAFRGAPRPLVVADETARQIWFVGGDQDISGALGEFGAAEQGESSGVFLLGEARRIDYKQRKEHVPDPDVDEWRHEFGEESGVKPALLFDSNLKRFLLSGGEYTIEPEGIVN
jgi:hypothetical protein